MRRWCVEQLYPSCNPERKTKRMAKKLMHTEAWHHWVIELLCTSRHLVSWKQQISIKSLIVGVSVICSWRYFKWYSWSVNVLLGNALFKDKGKALCVGKHGVGSQAASGDQTSNLWRTLVCEKQRERQRHWVLWLKFFCQWIPLFAKNGWCRVSIAWKQKFYLIEVWAHSCFTNKRRGECILWVCVHLSLQKGCIDVLTATSNHFSGRVRTEVKKGICYHFYFINCSVFKLVITRLYHLCNFKRLKASETVR